MMTTELTITVTPDERDDITLALREWVRDLDEPLQPNAHPRARWYVDLKRRRKTMSAQVSRLANRLDMAEWPDIAKGMPR